MEFQKKIDSTFELKVAGEENASSLTIEESEFTTWKNYFESIKNGDKIWLPHSIEKDDTTISVLKRAVSDEVVPPTPPPLPTKSHFKNFMGAIRTTMKLVQDDSKRASDVSEETTGKSPKKMRKSGKASITHVEGNKLQKEKLNEKEEENEADIPRSSSDLDSSIDSIPPEVMGEHTGAFQAITKNRVVSEPASYLKDIESLQFDGERLERAEQARDRLERMKELSSKTYAVRDSMMKEIQGIRSEDDNAAPSIVLRDKKKRRRTSEPKIKADSEPELRKSKKIEKVETKESIVQSSEIPVPPPVPSLSSSKKLSDKRKKKRADKYKYSNSTDTKRRKKRKPRSRIETRDASEDTKSEEGVREDSQTSTYKSESNASEDSARGKSKSLTHSSVIVEMDLSADDDNPLAKSKSRKKRRRKVTNTETEDDGFEVVSVDSESISDNVNHFCIQIPSEKSEETIVEAYTLPVGKSPTGPIIGETKINSNVTFAESVKDTSDSKPPSTLTKQKTILSPKSVDISPQNVPPTLNRECFTSLPTPNTCSVIETNSENVISPKDKDIEQETEETNDKPQKEEPVKETTPPLQESMSGSNFSEIISRFKAIETSNRVSNQPTALSRSVSVQTVREEPKDSKISLHHSIGNVPIQSSASTPSPVISSDIETPTKSNSEETIPTPPPISEEFENKMMKTLVLDIEQTSVGVSDMIKKFSMSSLSPRSLNPNPQKNYKTRRAKSANLERFRKISKSLVEEEQNT